jgi:hypothetical protein
MNLTLLRQSGFSCIYEGSFLEVAIVVWDCPANKTVATEYKVFLHLTSISELISSSREIVPKWD